MVISRGLLHPFRRRLFGLTIDPRRFPADSPRARARQSLC
ncbi:MAG: hypothetical protein Ct9H300mP16_14160 [Pseudomonadota bacterium]|nr:MAG: hypothetical protein Ct9H300mP16_14160 [Pseudomonadota bacterium]